MLQKALADGPALAFLADEVFLRDLHVGEKGFAERAGPADHGDRADFDAGRVHVDQHEADALVLVALVGSYNCKALVGPLAAAGPGLLAVDKVVVALVLGKGLEVREVRAGIGFRIALAPADFAAADRRNMLLLLCLVAVFEQRRAEHHDAHAADRVVGTRLGEFLVDDLGLRLGEAAAAVFLRPGGGAPAARAHGFAPLGLRRRFIGGAVHAGQRVRLALEFGGKIVRQKLLHFRAEGVFVGLGCGLDLCGHGCFLEESRKDR